MILICPSVTSILQWSTHLINIAQQLERKNHPIQTATFYIMISSLSLPLLPPLSLSLPSFPSLSSSSLFSGTKLLLNSKKGSGSALTSEVRDRAPVAKANFGKFVVKTRHLMARIMFFLVPLSRFGFWKGKHMPPLHLPVVSLSTVLYGDGLAITRSWVQTTSVATAYRHQLSMPSL